MGIDDKISKIQKSDWRSDRKGNEIFFGRGSFKKEILNRNKANGNTGNETDQDFSIRPDVILEKIITDGVGLAQKDSQKSQNVNKSEEGDIQIDITIICIFQEYGY